MTYAPEILWAVKRGLVKLPDKPTNTSHSTLRQIQRESMQRLRSRRRLGRPIVPNIIPINRGMWPPGRDGYQAWRREYTRLYNHIRRA